MRSYPPLSPLNDYVFKRLMEKFDLLIAFLQANLDLPPEEYQRVELVDPKLPGRYPRDKTGILDIKLITSTGKIIDIEVQVEPQEWMWERILFYAAGMIMDQIGEGEDYDKIKRVISIVITGHHLTPKNVPDYRHCFTLYDRKTAREYPRLLEIHTLELPKLPKESDGTPIWEWLRFFRSKTKGEFEMTTKNNPTLQKAWGVIKELSADENERLIAQAKEKERRDKSSQLKTALLRGERIGEKRGEKRGLKIGIEKGMEKGIEKGMEKGIEKGMEKGIEKGIEANRRENALAALQNGLAVDMVARIVGLTEEEVMELKKTHSL